MPDGVLSFDDVVKTFGATRALKGVSLDIRRGEVVALLGENGAGKSTLIKVLGGLFRPERGQMLIDGVPYRHQVRGGERSPVAFIHPDLGLIEWMTVAENIGLAGGFAFGDQRRFAIDSRYAAERAREALALVGCSLDPETGVASLSRTEKSLVAITRALMVDCDYLVLDEPTASLPADEVSLIADRVAVMRDGFKVGERRSPTPLRPDSWASSSAAPTSRCSARPRSRRVPSGPRCRTSGRLRPARSPSRSARANCSASSGCAAPGRRRSGARCSAPSPTAAACWSPRTRPPASTSGPRPTSTASSAGRGEGLAVVVVSTDFEEVAHICHRALVFNRGRIVAGLAGGALTTEGVITATSASEAGLHPRDQPAV